MFFKVGGPTARGLRQMRAQTSALYIIVLDFLLFALFLNHSARNASAVKKRGKISHFLTPYEKYGRVGGDVYTNYSCHT